MTGLNQPPDFAGSRYASRRAVLQKPISLVELSHGPRRLLDEVKHAPAEAARVPSRR